MVRAPAILVVNADPYAAVFIDGRAVGETPLVLSNLPAGTVRVQARHPTLGVRSQTMRLRPGQRRTITFDMNTPAP